MHGSGLAPSLVLITDSNKLGGIHMKAIVYHQYGSPDVLEITEVEKPTPGDDEVVLKVHAASVNPADWHLLRGTPYIARLQLGLRKPKDRVLGCDVAGGGEAGGKKSTKLRPGRGGVGGPLQPRVWAVAGG